MSDAYQIGAIGLRTQQLALDAIANNISNINTAGFKRSEIRFADVVASRPDATLLPADLQSAAPTLAGVALDLQFMLNDPGELQRTGAAMDVAIDGAGFIELMGPDGQSVLWRGGRLQIGDDGALTGAGGFALKANITVPDDVTALTIAADGTVRAQGADGTAPVELGQIRLVRLNDAADVTRMDGGLYRVADATRLEELVPGEDGAGQVIQGAIERSNVQLTEEMVRMMLVQRAYAANAQILQAADQMMGIANTLRR